MRRQFVFVLFLLEICYVCTKCPKPLPGEHGPCLKTCGPHQECSPGLRCCLTPCGGTVCKIPEIPENFQMQVSRLTSGPEPRYQPRHVPPSLHVPSSSLSFDHIQTRTLADNPTLFGIPSSLHRQSKTRKPNKRRKYDISLEPIRQSSFQHTNQQILNDASGIFNRAGAVQHLAPAYDHQLADLPYVSSSNDHKISDFHFPPVLKDHQHNVFEPHLPVTDLLHPQTSAPHYTTVADVGVGPCTAQTPWVKCWHDPCKVTTCPLFPTAKCQKSHCGECRARFVMTGVDITQYCHV